MTTQVSESIKEFARMCIIAVLPVIILSLEKQDFDVKATGIALALAILRAVDRYIHESDEGVFRKMNGISPF